MNRYITEFLGTFFLVFAIAFSGNPLAIGLTLAVSIYVGGHISGGHFNPAVSLALLLRKQMSPKDFIPYIIAQILGGAFAALVYGVVTTEIFMPAPQGSFVSSVIVETIATMLLVLVVLSVATTKALQGNYIYGLAIGLTITAMAYNVGGISGGVFNPAVATGPYLTGLSLGVGNSENLLLYLSGPFLGGVLGAIVFSLINKD